MNSFANASLLITGGTGSFGHAALFRFLQTDMKEIRIFSRDEKKQHDLRNEIGFRFPDAAGKVRFFLGDVRDAASVQSAMYGVDYVFHAAALKQVPACEAFPLEAVKTNVLGTENVLNAALSAGVRSVVCLSTDKAAYPVSAMGMTKALMEKLVIAKAQTIAQEKMRICCTRYGNILCSRGSVIPLWIEQIQNGDPITVTDEQMTRFIMSPDEAIDLVQFAFTEGASGDIFVKKASACTVLTQAEAVCELFQVDRTFIRRIGTRPGEKLYETLLTEEEARRAEDCGAYYRVPNLEKNDNSSLVRASETGGEFTSANVPLLSVEQCKQKLLALPYIREAMRKSGLHPAAIEQK